MVTLLGKFWGKNKFGIKDRTIDFGRCWDMARKFCEGKQVGLYEQNPKSEHVGMNVFSILLNESN